LKVFWDGDPAGIQTSLTLFSEYPDPQLGSIPTAKSCRCRPSS
jgi:hypothetical protein